MSESLVAQCPFTENVQLLQNVTAGNIVHLPKLIQPDSSCEELSTVVNNVSNEETVESQLEQDAAVQSIVTTSAVDGNLSNELPGTQATDVTKPNEVPPTNVFACEECSYTSHSKNYLKQHVHLVHDASRPFQCPYCNYAAKRNQSLQDHLLIHSDQRPFSCDQCNATFRKKGHLTNHIKMHSFQRMFDCTICKEQFPKRVDLYMHLRNSHTPDSVFSCMICEYATTIKSNIIMHMNTHSNPTIYKCSNCSFTAVHINLLNQHLRSHNLDPNEFDKHVVMTKSQPNEAKMNKIQLICSDCGFTTDQQSILKEHMIQHVYNPGILPVQGQTGSVQYHMRLDGLSMPSAGIENHSQSEGSLAIQGQIQGQGHDPLLPNTSQFFTKGPQTQQALEKTEAKNPSHSQGQGDNTTMEGQGQIRVQGQQQQIENEVNGQGADAKGQNQKKTIYKCTECAFAHPDTSIFINHMLSHAPLEERPPKPKRNTAALKDGGDKANAPDTAYTQDATRGFYKCAICGYTCEHQRTIKAHIWKHSGHKEIEYPMFQNGPLSIYDNSSYGVAPKRTVHKDTTILKVTDKKNEAELNNPMPGMPTYHNEAKTANQPISQSEVPKSLSYVSPSLVQLLRSDSHRRQAIQQINENVSYGNPVNMRQPDVCQMTLPHTYSQPTIPVPSHHYWENLPKPNPNPTLRRQLSAPPILHYHKDDAQSCVGSTVSDADNASSTGTSAVSSDIPESSAEPNRHVLPPISSIANFSGQANVVMSSGIQDSNLESNLVGYSDFARIIAEHNTVPPVGREHEIAMVVGAFEKLNNSTPLTPSIPSLDGPFGSNSPLSTAASIKRKAESLLCNDEREVEESIKKFDDGSQKVNVLVEKVTECYTLPKVFYTDAISQCSKDDVTDRPPSVGSVNSSKSGNKTYTEMLPYIYSPISSVDDKNNEDPTKDPMVENVSSIPTSTGVTLDHRVEDVSLLSLLKRGPNFNPAYPTETNKPLEFKLDSVPVKANSSAGETSETSTSTDKPKSGICSSLLAVIEHLRESSKTETDETKGVKPSRKKKRKLQNAEEQINETLNLELDDKVEMQEEGYRCRLCHYTTSTASVMKTHLKQHKSKQPKECSLCNFLAASSEELQEHMIQHCKIRTFQCRVCPANFSYKSQLRAHMRAHSTYGKEERQKEIVSEEEIQDNECQQKGPAYIYACMQCQSEFGSPEDLNNHMNICNEDSLVLEEAVSSITEWTCDECGYTTDKKADYISHARKHTKVYACKKCEFLSLTRNALTKHLVTHADKPLKCELCDFSALSTRSLKSHMKRHVNDQRFVQQPLEQYKCNMCGYLCHHLPSLKSHMWRHASDKKYSFKTANDVINAAIDFEVRASALRDTHVQSNKDVAPPEGAAHDSPEETGESLADQIIPIEAMIRKSLVTLRCCQCGFECIDKKLLTDHMKNHADVIEKTFNVSGSRSSGVESMSSESSIENSS